MPAHRPEWLARRRLGAADRGRSRPDHQRGPLRAGNGTTGALAASGFYSHPAQRAVGRLDLGFRRVGGATRIEGFYQEGCLKARLPRPQAEDVCEAVLINISGGVAGGDSLETAITLHPGARAVLATQAAERYYRSDGAPALVGTRIRLGASATLDYLPQETILFDRFSLRRSLHIDIASDARFLGLESLVFGRAAMGESLRAGSLRDEIRLHRDGRTVFIDLTRLSGDIAAQLGRPAIAGGAKALATLIYAAPDAPGRLAALRTVLEAGGLAAGATLIDGVIFARLLAPSAISLRSCVLAALRPLRDAQPLPRVWQS